MEWWEGAVGEESGGSVTFPQSATVRAVHLELPCFWQGWMKVVRICSTWIQLGRSLSFMQRL